VTDRDLQVHAISPVVEVTPARAVHPNVGREQLDLYERLLGRGHHLVEDPIPELVTTLTRDEIDQIEDHLPAGSTVASILGRALDYHPAGEHRPARPHPPADDGHVDVDA